MYSDGLETVDLCMFDNFVVSLVYRYREQIIRRYFLYEL